ncbi:hypothetical protein QBC43DRAFT_283133 [Cladorrhinum sp. PSN259]|nr:hypothetical protein QBC43DRAFT_283133 [Cladorrhinum sp. PSN259]
MGNIIGSTEPWAVVSFNAASSSNVNQFLDDDLASGQVPYLFTYDASQPVDVVLHSQSNTTDSESLAVSVADLPSRTSSASSISPESMQVHPAPYVDRPEDVTVAIEVKYIFPFLAPDAVDPAPHDPRPIQRVPDPSNPSAISGLANALIAQTIRSVAGEPAVTSEVIKANGKKERHFWDSHWIVKKAGSPEPRENELSIEGYVWTTVEIISHKYLATDPGTRDRIKGVLNTLLSSYRVVANYTCDTHIHLGREDNQAFTLETLQRLATLAWPAEKTLRSIRDPKSNNYHNIWTWGFETTNSRLGVAVSGVTGSATDLILTQDGLGIPDAQIVRAIAAQPSMPARELKIFQEIWKRDSHRSLGKLLSGKYRRYRRLGLNFSMFGLEDNRSRINPRTMEFRFMEGTIDASLAANWVVICARIVELAVLRSDDRYERSLRGVLQRIGNGTSQLSAGKERGAQMGQEFRELMEDLGVPKDVFGPFEAKVTRENCWEPGVRPVDFWENTGWDCAESDGEDGEKVSANL